MSSTEPPSRSGPRNQPQDTKAARDELSSKGKVEKVREIDADEQARKQRFQKFYREDAAEDEDFEAQNRPSPFDLLSGKQPQQSPGGDTQGPLGSSRSSSSSLGGDVDDAIVPGPAYTPPPSVNSFEGENEDNGMNAASEDALPQSNDFWEDIDLPDQPSPPANFQDTTNLTRSAGFEPPPARTQGGEQTKKAAGQKGSPGLVIPGAKSGRPGEAKGPVGKGPALPPGKSEKTPEASPFGPPGKPVHAKGQPEGKKKPEPVRGQTSQQKEVSAKKAPSPFEPVPKRSEPQSRAPSKEDERYQGPVREPSLPQKKDLRHPSKEESNLYQEPSSLPIKPEEKEAGGGGKERDQDKERKVVEIESPSLPGLPAHVQPTAMAAATQAAPYLNPAAANLFFQMVGTMYVMAGPQGVNRTEIVLNNPSFSGSKFFGSTITIEKYATAPDSFNIRLTGSHEAVVSFRENIPSLMSAFENGSFAFKVNRLDVEYSLEKPIFHRKEKGGDKGNAGGGDLGERRK